MSLTINLDRDKLARYIPTELDLEGKVIWWLGKTSDKRLAYRRGWIFAKSETGNPAIRVGLMPWTNLVEQGYLINFGSIIYFHNVANIYAHFAEISKGDYGVSYTGFHIQDDGHMHFEDDATTTDVDIGAVNAGETWLLVLSLWNDGGTKKILWWAGTWDYDSDSYVEKGKDTTGITTSESAYFKQAQVFEPNAVVAKGGVAGFYITKGREAGVSTIQNGVNNLMLSLRLHGLPKPQDVFPSDW